MYVTAAYNATKDVLRREDMPEQMETDRIVVSSAVNVKLDICASTPAIL